MIKQLLVMLVVLMSIGVVSAGEIIKEDGATIYIYGGIENTVYMQGSLIASDTEDNAHNYNKTICINATVIEGEISISNDDPYDLEYNFVADINDSAYISRIVRMKQETLSDSFLLGRDMKRTLYIDGVEIGNYETHHSWFVGIKKDTFYFCLIDDNIRYGEEVYSNISIAFTQLNYQDQQDMIPVAYNAKKKVSHKYISVGIDNGVGGMQLSGITGWLYNTIGLIPWSLGDSLQQLMFTPMAIIQYSFNFIFSFLFLIINNWWYAVLLLEIFCIVPALTHREYPEMVSTYIEMHAKIFVFMYHKVVLPVTALIMRIIEVVRNLFRI